MGCNLMRKDGEQHRLERAAMAPSFAPRLVDGVWRSQFESFADRVLDSLDSLGEAELCKAYATQVSGEALKVITGLTEISADQMDAWSQAMIDGIANYHGDPVLEARCRAATAAIDAEIDRMQTFACKRDGDDLLSAFKQADMPTDSIRANIKLTISGGQNEPRDAIAGTIWALLTHPEQLDRIRAGKASFADAFEEYIRWISPIGMSPRRVARPYQYLGIDFEPEDRVFLLFGSANRDEAHFVAPNEFDISRERVRHKHVAFGAGPHFCAGAAASRSLIAEVALPRIFERLSDLRLDSAHDVRFAGWAFRGPLAVYVKWRI